MKRFLTLTLLFSLVFSISALAQKKKKNRNKKATTEKPASDYNITFEEKNFKNLKFRNVGPFRGGRSVAATGVLGQPMIYYFGGVGGGVWKTYDAGVSWKNISDGFFKTGTIGAIAVAPSDPNVIYVGTGEHAVRGVMSSVGDGMYKSTDAGKTWKHIGLPESKHIGSVIIHPTNPDVVYVAVQGSIWAGTKERGVYKTTDGGNTWNQMLFVNETTACSDLSMDATNPRILYAGMWDNKRDPWKIRSGGKGSGIYKTTDGGETWKELKGGLPKLMGKVAVDVSPANPNIVYANIEAETGGVFRSTNGGNSWSQVNKSRVTVARAWYYIEIFADPQDANTVYVLNAPMLKSIDGGKTFARIQNPHSDQHDLWINPDDTQNMILANDGGATVTFNGGQTWSTQNNQPTAQFYRVQVDNQFPYRLYAGQQDNSTVSIASRALGAGIGVRDWYAVAGGESAFLAFDPDNPKKVYGTSIQGFIDVWDRDTRMIKDIMAYPQINLGTLPKDMKYRFNWNGPLTWQPQNPEVLYHGGNKLLRSDDGGHEWVEISPDLTRNDTSKHNVGGEPFTNEAAGGEVYNTISYIAPSPHQTGVIWVGADDGKVHVTMDEGKNWSDVSPPVNGESLINAIEVSPSDPATAYLAVTRYKFNDHRPMIYITTDYGETWRNKVNGIPNDNFVRVVREDPKQKGLLYAGTERGLYVSFNGGNYWQQFQSNLPVAPITDLVVKDNDLVIATSGRAFWILDDVSALQQTLGQVDTTTITLFEPEVTINMDGSGGRPSGSMGKNPGSGVVFDYYLPHDFKDSIELKLEVLDETGEVIRTITNQKDKDFKTWEGGPSRPATITSKPGLNRQSWDMRRESLPAVEGVFVMGSYAGSKVPSGKYTLRLSTDSVSQEVTTEIKADPRIKINPSDLAQQQKMLREIEAVLEDIHENVNSLRSVKSQLETRLGLIKTMKNMDDLCKVGEAALKAINTWENTLIQPKQETFQDVINFRNQLNAELMNLKGILDSGGDPKPTMGVVNRLKDLMADWQQRKGEMNRIIREDVGGFNKLYKEKNIPILVVPKVDKP